MIVHVPAYFKTSTFIAHYTHKQFANMVINEGTDCWVVPGH